MKTIAPILIACALLASLTACHKDQKAAQVQALEKAYKSGVFTKEEYDAKMQALLAPSAATPPAAPAPAAAPPPVVPPADANPPVAPNGGAIAAAPPVVPPPQAAPPVVPPPVAAPAPAVPQSRPAAQAPPVPQAAPVAPPPPPSQPPAASRPAPVAEQDDAEPAPLAGCQDAESRAGGPNGVQERFFAVSMDAVRRATVQAFENLDFTVHKDTPGEMEASKRRHLSAVVGAGGERLILHFSAAKKGGQSGTKVTAETKKSIIGKLAQKSWTGAVLAQIACNLKR